MKVLLADDDPISATVMESIITGAGHECFVVHDGDAAWALAQSPDAPRIMLIDWMMPGIDGLELCRRVRALDRAYTYVAIISVRAKQHEISLGFQAGADDFITKPYKTQQVLARLLAAERVIQAASTATSLTRVLSEVRESPGGDLLVRAGDVVGRIMFHAGRVAWAHVSNEPGSLRALLASEPSISRDEIDAILEESTETGTSFAEIIVDWDILSAEDLREHLRGWLAGKIASICRLTSPDMVFSPRDRLYTGGLLFELSEVFPAEVLAPPKPSTVITAARDEGDTIALSRDTYDALSANLEGAMAIEGALSAMVFDARTGHCVGSRGLPADLDLAWLALKLAAGAEPSDEVEDILISARHHIYILRPYSRTPPRYIFVALNRATVKLGMVRLGLSNCVEK